MAWPFRKKVAGLSGAQKQQWERDGFLVLPSFFTKSEVDEANRIIEEKMRKPERFGEATIDVLQGTYEGQRLKAKGAPVEAFRVPIKNNDMFMEEAKIRELALNTRLTGMLAELLEGKPMICNSLNFIWGSQQPDHFDTWYMPPPVTDKMAVSSICLEDVSAEAGPLAYYPGSHKWEPYRFLHGGIDAREAEMPACREYLQKFIDGAERKTFLGKAGDVFVWHGQLLHGGSVIGDIQRTRKTLVTHYWRVEDVAPERVVKVHETGYYLKRDYHG
jgi:hypothetical protein